MEEKKLTDDEKLIKQIRYLADKYGTANCIGNPSKNFFIDILGLINRLQDDYSNLKERYVKVLGLNEKVIAEQKAEIERLTEENGQLKGYNSGLEYENNELQMQVDKLRSENTELYKEHTTLIAGSILEKQNIVKDTAKEILPEMLARAKRLKEQFDSTTYGTNREHLIATIEIEIEGIKNLAKRYGVEVE